MNEFLLMATPALILIESSTCFYKVFKKKKISFK